jgi:DNA-binding beta-propeller fold protein YncE
VGTVELGGRPEFAVPDGNGRLFVNLEDSSQVRVVDTKTMTAGARWGLGSGEEPTGIAIDVARQRLFVSCGNAKMVILDSKDGRVVATLPTGKGVDGAGFDPALQRAFSPSGSDSVLTVIGKNGDSEWEVLESVPTERGARTMALDEMTHRVYLVTAKFGPPPAPTADRPRPRPPILPGTFEVLVYGE